MSINKVSIVIPVFNEEATIGILLEKILASKCLKLRKELVVINDCSTDTSQIVIDGFVEKIHQFGANSPLDIKTVSLLRNSGKTHAISKGVELTTGDIIIIQDGDLEYDPHDYDSLISPIIQHEADVVYGSRFTGNEPKRILYFWHTVGNKFLTLISNVCSNLNLTDMETGYKAFKGDLLRKLAPQLTSRRFGFEPEITARIAKIPEIKIYEIGIRYWGRTYKEGKKIGWKDGIFALGQIIKYNLMTR
jgi:glycosyltransferase involved in cell wall biosynthesis